MPQRCTVTLTSSRTFRFDAPDDMSTRALQALVDEEADRLMAAPDIEVRMNKVDVTRKMVQDAPRVILRVSDDRKRITDEEVEWEK